MGELEGDLRKASSLGNLSSLAGKPANRCPFPLSLHLGSACPGWPLACPEDSSSHCCGRQWMGWPLSEVCIVGQAWLRAPQLSEHRSFQCCHYRDVCQDRPQATADGCPLEVACSKAGPSLSLCHLGRTHSLKEMIASAGDVFLCTEQSPCSSAPEIGL